MFRLIGYEKQKRTVQRYFYEVRKKYQKQESNIRRENIVKTWICIFEAARNVYHWKYPERKSFERLLTIKLYISF